MLNRSLIVAVLIVGASLAVQRASKAAPIEPRASLSTLPLTVGGWVGRELPAWDERVQQVLGADQYVNRRYVRGDDTADLYVGYYGSQRQGDSIHSPQNCLPGAGWQPVENDRVSLPIGPGRSAAVNRYIIQKNLDQQVVLYWFQGRGRVVASEYANRMYLVFDSLRTRRSDGALVRIMVPARADSGAASAKAESFAAALYPTLSEVIP